MNDIEQNSLFPIILYGVFLPHPITNIFLLLGWGNLSSRQFIIGGCIFSLQLIVKIPWYHPPTNKPLLAKNITYLETYKKGENGVAIIENRK